MLGLSVPMLHIEIFMKRIFAVLILACALGGCSCMPGGEGVVLETGTGHPIVGAVVKLECRKGGLHGSTVVKTLQTTTGESGRYAFAAADVASCSFAYVKALKQGYVDAAGLNLMYDQGDYASIPKQIVLTPEGEKNMVRLRFNAGMVVSASGPSASNLYTFYYPFFEEAQRLAKTDKERGFVREAICPSLMKVYSGLSEQDRTELRGTKLMARQGGGEVMIDHEGQVAPYCSGAVPGS